MLVLTRKLQEQIRIGDNVTITVLRVKGQAVRIGIDAPRELRVVRGELPPAGAQRATDPAAASAAALPQPAVQAQPQSDVEESLPGGDEMPPLASLRRLPQRRMINRHGVPPLRIACSHALASSATT
jgi:carbon storage regulator CsrA